MGPEERKAIGDGNNTWIPALAECITLATLDGVDCVDYQRLLQQARPLAVMTGRFLHDLSTCHMPSHLNAQHDDDDRSSWMPLTMHAVHLLVCRRMLSTKLCASPRMLACPVNGGVSQ